MCTQDSIGRRAFMVDLGRGALAIAVFSPLVVACGSGDDVAGGTTTTPTTAAPGSTSPPTTSSTSTTGSTSAPTTAPTTSDGGTGGETTAVASYRVNLGFVSAYVLVRGETAAVVDTGIAGSAGAIGDALSAASLGWADVRHVLLTHHHPDHVGSLAEVLGQATDAVAYAGEPDIPSIASPRPLRPVADGDDVFGLRIVGTPGHTAGHVSIYDPVGQLLVVGDAITNFGDELTGPNPEFTADMATAVLSAKKLATFDVQRVMFGHGEPIERDAGPRLVALAASL
jgi:glyoxylase-like metal-dependent hydrolase (beta-lactamase superfamily II)